MDANIIDQEENPSTDLAAPPQSMQTSRTQKTKAMKIS